MSIFSKRLATIMKLKKMTQADLATKAHIKRQTISQYIKDKTYPNAEVLGNIATVLNVSADYLLGLTDIMSPSSDVRSICDYIGLNDYAVNFLHKYLTISNPTEDDYSNQLSDGMYRPRDFINDLFKYSSKDIICALNEICHGINRYVVSGPSTPVVLLSEEEKQKFNDGKLEAGFIVLPMDEYQEAMIAKGIHRILRSMQAICFKRQNPILSEVFDNVQKD